jgi:hypothetical protein
MTIEPRHSQRVADGITQFKRVEQQRADEYVAEQLERQIGLRLIQPG